MNLYTPIILFAKLPHIHLYCDYTGLYSFLFWFNNFFVWQTFFRYIHLINIDLFFGIFNKIKSNVTCENIRNLKHIKCVYIIINNYIIYIVNT